MSHFGIRLKNDAGLKSRVLLALMSENSSYSIREYREEPDPSDNNYLVISFTAYEKSPYCPIRNILSEFIRNNEVEYLNESPAERRI